MKLRINEDNDTQNIDRNVIKLFTNWLKDYTTEEDLKAKNLYIRGYITMPEMIDQLIKNHI